MPSELIINTDIEAITTNLIQNVTLAVEEALKYDALNYYANRTEEQKKRILSAYKEGFKNYKEQLNNTSSLEDYFKAYEYILNFRKFILGEIGEIDYTFVLSATAGQEKFIKSITLKSEDFKNLIFDKNNNIVGLVNDYDNLRFSSAFIKQLRSLIKNINQQGINIQISPTGNNFILVNENLGTRQQFTSGQLFKSRIAFLQRQYNTQHWYSFDLDVTKDISAQQGAAVFKYKINKVSGNPLSSSVFSAIGKYFSDEMTAKRQAVSNSFGYSIDPSYPNVGNLTQLYILAKERLNNKHNNFRPRRRRVSGATLFELWNEVRANTEPFYSGGDVLMEQIKSFLGANPSLTSYSTLRQSINNFYNAINNSNIKDMQNKLSQLLLQESTVGTLSQEQKNLSKTIAKAFNDFFRDLR